jgi:maltose O-acetyltransferase
MPDYFAGDARTNFERMLAGDQYIADDPKMAAAFDRTLKLQTQYAAAYAQDRERARPILEELLGELGEEAHVRPPLFLDYGSNLYIGARTFVNYNLTALDVTTIRIGADCQIGPNVQLLAATHPLEPEPRRDKLEGTAPITLGDNVWLGGGVIVLPGVSIGENTVVGAGAVVSRDLPANVIATGVPARVTRTLP